MPPEQPLLTPDEGSDGAISRQLLNNTVELRIRSLVRVPNHATSMLSILAEGGGRSWPVWETGPPAWLPPPKPGRDPAQQHLEFPVPADRVYAVARGHHLIFGCAHTIGS
jgi:hypothetical protein